ncbi:hypothetical protein MKL29_06140 [Streptococcus suis]|nr:hypothetical protein [Streptococcus suis]
MKKIKISHFEFEYNPIMDCAFDEKQNRLVFLSENYGDVHLAIEVKGTTVTFQPKWNVNITADEQQPNKYILDVNTTDF